jgi:hypothetical protein
LDGQEVGRYAVEGGVAKVKLDLTYECSTDEWVIPLSWFDYGLHKLQKYQPRPADLQLKTGEDSIAEIYDVPRLLTEKLVKRAGYVWNFHKADADPWPSRLHGHDYENNLKLDAITGEIYDVGTRQRCKRLKGDDLKAVQQALRESKDFHDQVVHLINLPVVDNNVHR